MSNRKVLVMSVGGSPEPLIHSIDNIKPKLVYFIHSEKTLSVVDEINKNTKHKYDYLTKQVDNHESIEDAFEKSKEVLFELNKKGWDEITIDFTGGTKPMTAGLVLASTGDKYTDSYNYSYVGSKMSENAEVRNKDGVGIVISGHEQIKPQKDPYDTYAVLEFNRGKNFFNHYQFEAAIQNFKEAEAKLDDGELKDLAKFYIKLVNFYQKWDKFNDRIEIYNEKLDKIESFKLPSYFYKEIIQKCPNELLNNDFDKKSNKPSREKIRDYLLKNFFNDHKKTYKKCPIYWQFSSGKEKGFNCLIYMHRYEPSLVARIRTDYLHKTQKAIEQAIANCDNIINHSSSKQEVVKATKDKAKLQKQLKETQEYDEALAHIANQNIEIDLDDGVKVNYAKFQNVHVSREGKKSKKINLLKKL